MTKIIANYLPQYHSIPENDKWWGKGYTDWTAVKNSVPLFEGHLQPKVPLGKRYYQLDNIESIKWQAEIAKKYGIDGFGIYHYWFNDNLHLLDKPTLLLKDCRNIDIGYMLIWDNSSWVRSWSNVKIANDWAPMYEGKVDELGRGILAELIYGKESSWKKHFDYLMQFFKDSRYIKIDNQPVFAIYNQNNQPDVLKKMCEYWNELAIKNGFSGIYILGKKNNKDIAITDHQFLYQPEWSGWMGHNALRKVVNRIQNKFWKEYGNQPVFNDYDSVWKSIIRDTMKHKEKDLCFGGFVNYDDTPRRGNKGRVVKGATPGKFENYVRQLLQISKKYDRPFFFLTAWNEWGEGAYLEPDGENGYAYLEALKRAVDSVDLEN